MKNTQNNPIVIIGAGISGATLAERFASVLDKKVIVIEKRDHIGGNCYDYYNNDGVLVSKYGAHIFHTSYEDVWEYVNRFSKFRPYQHKVLSYVNDKLVPVPVNIRTVNQLFSLDIKNENQMKEWLSNHSCNIEIAKNSEESALKRVGKELFELLFKPYTKKQWDLWPVDLEASVMDRIPVRTDFNDRYFSDTYEGIPEPSYTQLFERMLSNPNITVLLNTDWFKVKDRYSNYDKLFFTGPIDQFFSHKYDKLQYRSLKFEFETFREEYYQEKAVINYPSLDFPWTRIVEFKHLTGQEHPYTTISKEYGTWDGEPYYPVPTEQNRRIYKKYQEEADQLETENVFFVGRLANYKYFNMDQAFKNALDLFSRVS